MLTATIHTIFWSENSFEIADNNTLRARAPTHTHSPSAIGREQQNTNEFFFTNKNIIYIGRILKEVKDEKANKRGKNANEVNERTVLEQMGNLIYVN